jgi:hypothetical protein
VLQGSDEIGRIELSRVELLRPQRLPEDDGVDAREVGHRAGVQLVADENCRKNVKLIFLLKTNAKFG